QVFLLHPFLPYRSTYREETSMAARTWVHKLFRRNASSGPCGWRPGKGRKRALQGRCRLYVEALEDRALPSGTPLVLELLPAAGQAVPAPVTIALTSFHFGFANPVTLGSAGSGAGAGKATFGELQVSAPLSGDSPLLLASLASGAHYQTALLTQSDANGQPVAAWALD